MGVGGRCGSKWVTQGSLMVKVHFTVLIVILLTCSNVIKLNIAIHIHTQMSCMHKCKNRNFLKMLYMHIDACMHI